MTKAWLGASRDAGLVDSGAKNVMKRTSVPLAMRSLTCQYNQEKPEWMDGGVRQKEITEQIKREVKAGSQRRRWERVVFRGPNFENRR
jgi:hypothetical protein